MLKHFSLHRVEHATIKYFIEIHRNEIEIEQKESFMYTQHYQERQNERKLINKTQKKITDTQRRKGRKNFAE